MVSSPPRSLLYRTSWYTALGVAALLLLPATAGARYALQDGTPPLVAYSIDGIDGSNGWYLGSTSGSFIVVHSYGLGSRITDPIDDRLRACDPHRRPEHRHDAHLLGHERGRHDDGDDEAAQGRRDGSVDHRRGDDRPEHRGLVPNSGHAPVERHRRDLGDRLLQPAADVQQPGHDRHEQERQLCRQRREHVGRRADCPLRLDTSRHAGRAQPGAQLARLASVGGHGRVERFGHDVWDRLVQRTKRLQRARHARSDPERQLHRQRRQQLERKLRRQVRHAPTGDDRRPGAGPERSRVVPRAGDDLRQRHRLALRGRPLRHHHLQQP